MKRKDIENAAREFSDLWMGNLIQISDFYQKCYFEEGFRHGAEYRAATVWNEPYKEPARFVIYY